MLIPVAFIQAVGRRRNAPDPDHEEAPMASKQLSEPTRQTGIRKIHQRGCPAGDACRCSPSYQANVWDARKRGALRRAFPTMAAAVTWRQDSAGLVRAGKLKAGTPVGSLAAAAAGLIAGMRDGAIRNRSGRQYKPSSIRSYERNLRLHVEPTLGHRPWAKVERVELQALVERLTAAGLSRSTIDNALDPIRVLYRRAIEDGLVAHDPTAHLRMPANEAAVRASVDVPAAEALVAAAPARDRAFWALAFYASLRRGELRALRVSDIDEGAGVVRVRRTWDDSEAEVSAKSEAGQRDVPLIGPSRQMLAAHLLATGRSGEDLVFGVTAEAAFDPSTVQYRADRAWADAGLARVTPHELRKSGYNLLRLAGVDRYVLQRVFGHGGKTDSDALYGAVLDRELAAIRVAGDAFLVAE